MGARKSRLQTAMISGAGGAVLTALLRSARSELVSGEQVEMQLIRPEGIPSVTVVWHGRLLPAAYHFRRAGYTTLISQNRDGDLITPLVERWGFRVIRGSSSRGGSSALRQIVKVLSEGGRVALTPDGPRGPRQKMKLGPLHAARLAGVPIIPGAAGAARGAYFGRWDRFLVPAPFTRVSVALGEPLEIPPDARDGELREYANELEARLNAVTELVDEAACDARR